MIEFSIFGFGHIGKLNTTIAIEYPGCSVVAIVDLNPKIQNDLLSLKGADFISVLRNS